MHQSNLISDLFFVFFAVISLVTSNGYAASGTGFQDPLSTSAVKIDGALKLEQQPILAVAMANGRVIGVGLRGLIVLSDNGGATWRQAQVPVQSDLTAVSFPTKTRGWAVGHDGVILTTRDAGETWSKQLDGKMATSLLTEYYQKRIDAGDANMQRYLAHVKLNDARGSATLPYLSVCFENEQTGYAVGSFGSILVTQDGGKTWEPWLHNVDNEKFLNLNEMRRISSNLYMVGEHGIIWKLDKAKQRFNAVATGYRGSFFSIEGSGEKLLAVGLGGAIFRSTNGGTSWQSVSIGTHATLTAITATRDGLLPLIASQDGELFIGDAGWQVFRTLPADRRMPFTSSMVAYEAGRIILAGYGGIQVHVLQTIPATTKEK